MGLQRRSITPVWFRVGATCCSDSPVIRTSGVPSTRSKAIRQAEDAELGPGHDDPGSTTGTDGTVADACGVEALPAFLADVLGILVEPVKVLRLAGFLGFGSTAGLLCGTHLFDGLGGEAVDEQGAGALDLKLEHPEVGRGDDERFDGLRGCRLGGCCHL
jgi:hypothetical protein